MGLGFEPCGCVLAEGPLAVAWISVGAATQRMLNVGLETFGVCSKLERFSTRSVLFVSPTHVPTFAVAFVGLGGPSVDNSGHQRFRPSLFLSRS